jgi:O-antigen/teichoic acid export membrane protein
MLDRNLTNLISVSFAGRIIGSGLQYLTYLIVGRQLGAEALGVFTFGIVVLNLGTLVSKVGLDKAVKKFVPMYDSSDRERYLSGLLVLCLGIPFVLGCGIALSLYVNSDVINRLTAESFGATLTVFLVGIPFMTVMVVGRAATTGFLTTKYAVYIKDIGQSVSAILFVLVASIYIGTTRAVVVGYVLSIVFAALLAVYYLYDLGAFKNITRPTLQTRRVLVYSLPLTVVAVSQYLITWTDVLMLGSLGTAAEVGRYQAAFQTAMILGLLPTAVGSIFPSVASKLYSDQKMEQLRVVYGSLTKWVSYFTCLGFVFIFIHSSQLLLIFGGEFSDAGPVLALLAGVNLVTALVGPAGFLLMMTDNERLEIVNTVLAAMLNIILNFFLIQEYGILGAAMATGTAMIFANVVRLAGVWRFMKIRPFVESYGKGVVAVLVALPAMFVGQYIPAHYLVSLFVSGAASLAVFLAVVYALGLSTDDKSLFETLS